MSPPLQSIAKVVDIPVEAQTGVILFCPFIPAYMADEVVAALVVDDGSGMFMAGFFF